MKYDFPSRALVERISTLIDLSAAETELLRSLCGNLQQIPRHTDLREAGSPLDHLICVESGWLVSHTSLLDGRRQVQQICLPGDIIGLADIVIGKASSDVRSLTRATISTISPASLQSLALHPAGRRLNAVLTGLCMQANLASADRIRVLGRMNARERLIHFLLCLYYRLERIGMTNGNGFDFPLTQFDIADAIGLTNVSVSNTLGALQGDGIIKRSNGYIEIVDFDQMQQVVQYQNREADLDLSWLIGREMEEA